ncbi:hypothetical protein FQA39_LY14017 [Lamprigera yunnana]|nr:hypothetical protein FQA39_LY14017 [Lamprigera yunnana]
MTDKATCTYLAKEVNMLAPGYRGKAANFNPSKVKVRSTNVPKEKRSTTILPQTHLTTEARPQRNESIISEAIFGIDVMVMEIAPKQSFAANYAKLIDLATQTYDAYRVDVKQLDRELTGESENVLTSAEKDIRRATSDEEGNVPQPLYYTLMR